MRCYSLLLFLVLGVPAVGLSATVYTYVDDKGTVVMTDQLKKVPPRYRNKVKTLEQNDPPPRVDPVSGPAPPDGSRPAPMPAQTRAVVDEQKRSWSQFFWNALPEEIVPGLTQYQSVLLIGGFVIGSTLFAVLMFTRNPALQFAMKWALTFVVAGTLYGMYFAELGTTLSVKGEEQITDPRTVLDQVRVKVKGIEQRQEERIKSMEHMEQGGPLEELNQP